MRHIAVFLVLALSIYFLAVKKSDLEILMVPATDYSQEHVGNRFVDVDPRRFPMTPAGLAERGVITVVYFHDDTCPGCLKLDRDLEDFLRVRPDVAVRKVRMSLDGDAYYQTIRNYQWPVYMAPCILLFGKNGKLIAADKKTNSDGQDLLEEWIYEELRRAGKRS